MSDMDVLAIVCDIISAYHDSAELVKLIMARRHVTGAESLQGSKIKQLLNSLVASEQQIGSRYTQDLRDLGDAVQVGDAIAQRSLQIVAVRLRGFMLGDLRMLKRSEDAVNDFEYLLHVSVTSRQRILKTLDDLRQRNMMAKPLQHPFGQRPGSSETFQALSRHGYRSVDDASKRYIPFAPVSRPDTPSGRSVAADHFPKKGNSSAATLPSSRSNIGVRNPPTVNYAAAFEQLVKRRGEGHAITVQVTDEVMVLHQSPDAGDRVPTVPLSYALALDPHQERAKEHAYDWPQTTTTVTSTQIKPTWKKYGKRPAMFSPDQGNTSPPNPYMYYSRDENAASKTSTQRLDRKQWSELYTSRDSHSPDQLHTSWTSNSLELAPLYENARSLSDILDYPLLPFFEMSSTEAEEPWLDEEYGFYNYDGTTGRYLAIHERTGTETSAPDSGRPAAEAAQGTFAQDSTPTTGLAEKRRSQNRVVEHRYQEKLQKAHLQSDLDAERAAVAAYSIEEYLPCPIPSVNVFSSDSAVVRSQPSSEIRSESVLTQVPSSHSERSDIEQIQKTSKIRVPGVQQQSSPPKHDGGLTPSQHHFHKESIPYRAHQNAQNSVSGYGLPFFEQTATTPERNLEPSFHDALAIPQEVPQEANLVSSSAERHSLIELVDKLPSGWEIVRDCLPESYKWDVEFTTTHCATEHPKDCWTCTPCLSDQPKQIPLTIATAPVVLPVEHVWPPIGGVSPPPDPRLSRLIDCRGEIDIEVIRDIFVTFEGSIGFYVLINGLLQVIVTKTFDTTWASSHLPHKFGGLKVSYIQQDLEPTMLPTETTTTSREPTSGPHITKQSDFFKTAQTHRAAAVPSLQLNDTIEARGKSLHREKYTGRIGLSVSNNDNHYLLMSSHVITEAILARSLFGIRRQHTERLADDWNNHVEIWAGSEKFGSVFKTFDTEAGIYPNGFQHDVTLIKPKNYSSISSIKAPLSGLGWLSQSDWSKLRQQTMPVKILGSDNVRREAKTLECSLDSEVLVVGEGIFFNQMAAAGARSAKDHDKSTWTKLVSRAILYRVYPDFDPPNGYSGIALYVERTKEDGTQVSEIAGFQSFVQRSGQVQNFGMEGPALEQRLRTGRIAFYGAFQVPDELRRDFNIL